MTAFIGTAGDDICVANSDTTSVWGGTAGQDILQLSGNAADYRVFDNQDGSLQLVAIQGEAVGQSIKVRDVEKFQFIDAELTEADLFHRAHTEFFGSNANDILRGSSGDDQFFASAGDDIVWGGMDGTDALHLNGGKSDYAIYDLGDGRHKIVDQRDGAADGTTIVRSIESLNFSDGAMSLQDFTAFYGANGINIVNGTSESESLNGTAMNDELFAGGGNDNIWGGVSGTDTAVFTGNIDAYHMSKNLDGTMTIRDLRTGSPDGTNKIRDIDIFRFADRELTVEEMQNYNFDHAQATDGNDVIFGTDGADVIYGGKGDDRLFGLTPGDYIDGGDGFDSVDYHNSSESIYINLMTHQASGGEAEGDVLVNIEAAYGSNTFDDIMIGDNAANFFCGLGGQDQLYGLGGDDTLRGAQDGDWIDGGEGFDTATYWASPEGVVVDLEANAGSAATADGDTLISIEQVVGSNTGHDALYAAHAGSVLVGNWGNDVLVGRDGDDTLRGGSGDDTLQGGAGQDHLNGGSGHDVLAAGSGDDVLLGEGGDDLLQGDDGNDRMYGAEGNDRLSGGAGDDILRGGAGEDLFIFALGEGVDRVRDFTQGEDHIDLTAIYGALRFIGKDEFSGDVSAVNYHWSYGQTIVGVDANADAVSDMEIVFDGEVAFVAEDFVF